VPNPDADGYTVPADNPFVNQPGIRPELWAKGLRNPWGFCRDDATGDLWLSDVGNRTMEEIDRIPAGQGGLNFGWYWIEGSFVRVGGAPDGLTPPVFTYRHDDIGLAAIGGCVYRGTSIPALRGAYVFADLAGRFFAIGAGDVTVELDRLDPSPITGFVTLPDGEMLVLTLYQGVFRLLPA
jgi:glucose/arabinose dehydrogenase